MQQEQKIEGIDYKELIRKEYLKCANNPIHFCNSYCMVQHPIKGKIPFILYNFQLNILKQFIMYDKNIVLKSRQMGLSTLVAAYSLWMMTFYSDKNILVLATSQETAKNLVTKVLVMYDELPSWLKTPTTEKNKMSLKFNNGSGIKAVSSKPDSARSEALSLLIVDEAAFIYDVDKTWTAAQQTIATGGRAIVLSTPNGVGNWFHQMWIKAVEGENGFNHIKIKWNLHPERDKKWRDKQTKELGSRMAAQECLAGESIITVKNIETDEIFEICIEDLYEKLR